MLIKQNEIEDFIKDKSIGVFFFNKDVKHFLELGTNLNIKYILDFSLQSRPAIKQEAELVKPNGCLVVDNMKDIKSIIDNNQVDLILIFDGGWDEFFTNEKDLGFRSSLFDAVAFDEKFKTRWEAEKPTIKKIENYEYIFRMNFKEMNYIVSYIVYNSNIMVTQAYSNKNLFLSNDFDIDPIIAFDKREAQVVGISQISEVPSVDITTLKDKKVIFVNGSDYGIGKGTYMIKKYNEGHSVYFFDQYYQLTGKGVAVINNGSSWKEDFLYKFSTSNKESCYLKLEGRLDNFLMTPEIWNEFHNNFNYEFQCVVKEGEDIEQGILNFCNMYNVNRAKVKIIESVNHSSSFVAR
jgi:hypothetical protein